jgi:hypothetical protein
MHVSQHSQHQQQPAQALGTKPLAGPLLPPVLVTAATGLELAALGVSGCVWSQSVHTTQFALVHVAGTIVLQGVAATAIIDVQYGK